MGFKARKKTKALTEVKAGQIEHLANAVLDLAVMLETAATNLETYIDNECPDVRNYFNDTFNHCSGASEFVDQDLSEFQDDTVEKMSR